MLGCHARFLALQLRMLACLHSPESPEQDGEEEPKWSPRVEHHTHVHRRVDDLREEPVETEENAVCVCVRVCVYVCVYMYVCVCVYASFITESLHKNTFNCSKRHSLMQKQLIPYSSTEYNVSPCHPHRLACQQT